MNKKRRAVIIGAILLALALCGVAVYAANSYGSSSDPLIAKSYLDEVFTPRMEELMQTEIDAALENMDAAGSGGEDNFIVLTLSKGQKVTCEVGCEVMLRIGTATANGPDYPVLVDTTTADSLSNGKSLVTNHLYMITIKGNGFTATADTVKVLIRGDYTVS